MLELAEVQKLQLIVVAKFAVAFLIIGFLLESKK